MLRRLALGLLVAIPLLATATPVSAADGESIAALKVDVAVTPTGAVHFRDTIVYDFGNNERHGIIRAIPRWDDLPDNKRRRYDLRVDGVLMDGQSASVRESDEGAFHMVTIGDPDRTVSGRHTYIVAYTISNALTTLTAADLTDAPGVAAGDVELYWDFIGDGWQVPIAAASVEATTPEAALLTRCYAGPSGSTAVCTMISNGRVTRFGPVALAEHEPLTGVVVMPRAAFTAVPAADIIERPASAAVQFARALRWSGPIGLLFLGWLVMLARRRRARIVTVPVTDFVRFEAPPGLRPAEMAVAWKGSFDGRVLTATLLDLAARGALVITPKGRKRIVVTRVGKDVALDTWEQSIVDAALKGTEGGEVGKYDAKLAKAVQRAGTQLKQRAQTSGIRNAKAWRARTPWIVLSVLGFLATGFGFALFVVPLLGAPVACLGVATMIGGAVGAKLTPLVQTETSADFLSQVLGFRRLLDTDAGAARREFAQRSGLSAAAIFATMLPWAVIYGVDEAWAGAFPDLTPAELMAYGLGFASANAVHDDIASATRALSSAMTNPASGGSGASGGSSGGGGGGGGGSSW